MLTTNQTPYEIYALGNWATTNSTTEAQTTLPTPEPPVQLAKVELVKTIEFDKSLVDVELLTQFAFDVPMPECIMQNEKQDKVLEDGSIKKGGYFTTVKWNDGTYTTVKASEGDESERSVYIAFCAALAKKLYGTNAAVHRIVTRHTEEYINAQKQKEKEENRAKERAAEQAAHERALLKEAKRLRLKAEAKRYNIAHAYDKE